MPGLPHVVERCNIYYVETVVLFERFTSILWFVGISILVVTTRYLSILYVGRYLLALKVGELVLGLPFHFNNYSLLDLVCAV